MGLARLLILWISPDQQLPERGWEPAPLAVSARPMLGLL
jgi:hypothetical protein